MTNDFYGDDSNQAVSFLEFGSIHLGNQSKSTWAFLLHQDAYDFYMFPRYARDLFRFRDFINDTNPTPILLMDITKKTGPKDMLALLLKYAGYMAVKDTVDSTEQVTVCEIGSSLFGLIDEIAALDKLLNNGNNTKHLMEGKYIGCEISDLMNKGAKELHPSAHFELYTDSTAEQFLNRCLEYDLFFSISISMQYSLRNTSDVADICKQSKLSVMRHLCFSIDETRAVNIGTGKMGYYIGLNEFMKLLEGTGMLAKFYQYGVTSNDITRTIAVDMVVGRPDEIDSFVNHFSEVHQLFSKSVGLGEGSGEEWCDFSILSDSCLNKGYTLLKEKRIILFGAGKSAIKTFEKLNLNEIEVVYSVDNDREKWGTYLLGLQVNSPDFLLQEPKEDTMIIITSIYYTEISSQLKQLGFMENEHFMWYKFLY
jgi:hypothetical protein